MLKSDQGLLALINTVSEIRKNVHFFNHGTSRRGSYIFDMVLDDGLYLPKTFASEHVSIRGKRS